MTDRINRIRNLLAKIPEPVKLPEFPKTASAAYEWGIDDGRRELAEEIRKILEDDTD